MSTVKKKNKAIGVITKVLLQKGHGKWIAAICGICPYTQTKPTKFVIHYGLMCADDDKELNVILKDANTPDSVSDLVGTVIELTYTSKTDIIHGFHAEDKKLKYYLADECSIKVLDKLMLKKKK